MTENTNEQIKELDKLYYSYIRTLYNLLNYSLNSIIDKDHIEVKYY